MAEPIYKGSLLRVIGTFRDDVPTSATYGQTIDPTTVSFVYIDPTPTTTTYTYPASAQLVRESQGVYHVDVSCTASGDWKWRYVSTGTGQASIEGQFHVEASNF